MNRGAYEALAVVVVGGVVNDKMIQIGSGDEFPQLPKAENLGFEG